MRYRRQKKSDVRPGSKETAELSGLGRGEGVRLGKLGGRRGSETIRLNRKKIELDRIGLV